MRYNEDGLFPVLEAALKASPDPLDCQTLYDMPSIKDRAASVNRVSDYLGNMWRKGLIVRLPAPKLEGSRARWLYAWKGQKGPLIYGIEHTPKILADRPAMLISEDGLNVTIELENLIITVRQKPGK